MKSSAPWSVKGIKRDARETAKEAARRHGMTVGEWLSQVIFTAGDPESSDGEIEGLKTSDLVNAIEHLNKRVITAESRGVEAMEDLARNLGGVLERLQRLERTRPTEGGPGVEERLQRLESKSGDRQRIDALRALEKAVGQVALQYDSAHKSTLSRLESTERQLQELASRLDLAGAEASGEPAGIAALRDTITGLADRLERAERVAAEAAKFRAEAGESVDAEFVERTGARLRILGDEIKRGGDQIRTLEGLIRKLSDQIDAAERRSSEGVQKVAETISQLRSQFTQPEPQDPGDARQELEAAMAEVTRRTEMRINELQRSFESMIARLDAPSDPARPRADIASAPAVSDDDAFEADDDGDTIFDALDAGDKAGGDDDTAFSFDAGGEALAPAAATTDADSRHGGAPATGEPDDDEEFHPAADAGFGEFDDLDAGTPAAPAPMAARDDDEEDDPLRALVANRDAADDQDSYLRQTRRAVREASEKAAEAQARRRKLTPRQRALLAAKIRRKRLAEQGLTMAAAAPAETPVESEPAPVAVRADIAAETRAEKPGSVFARAAGVLSALRPQHSATAEDHAGEAAMSAPTKVVETEEDGSPNLTRAARALLARVGVKPVTLALGVAVVLAAAALFFLVRDIVSGGAPSRIAVAEAPAPAAEAPTAAPTQNAAANVPATPSEPLTQPRALYLESVAKLGAAKTEAQTHDALKILQQAAALGHPPAQLQLGELYKLGQGVEQDPAQARIWYQRAAEGGNVLAMHRAGVMAARGQGGASDLPAAIAWFEKAANFGLVDSQYNLGATYHPASGGGANPVQDPAKAYYWYSLAARNGDTQAKTLAAGLAASLSPDERRVLDERVAAWTAAKPDAAANEVASAS